MGSRYGVGWLWVRAWEGVARVKAGEGNRLGTEEGGWLCLPHSADVSPCISFTSSFEKEKNHNFYW